MSRLPKDINSRRLKIELLLVGLVVFGIILWRFLPWLFVQPISTSSDHDQIYKNLYNTVLAYDFSKGRDEDLEKRMERAIEGNSTSSQLYYNLKARIEYNHRLQRYDEVREDIDRVEDYIPDEEERTYIQNTLLSLPN